MSAGTSAEPGGPESVRKRLPVRTYQDAAERLVAHLRIQNDPAIDRILQKADFDGSELFEEAEDEVEAFTAGEGATAGDAEDTGKMARVRYWCGAIWKCIKFCTQAFFAWDVFMQMSHDRSGCMLQNMRKDGSVSGSRKICESATWHRSVWMWWPRSGIKSNCNCDQTCDDAAGIQVPRDRPPKDLIKAGCQDIGDPQTHKCHPCNKGGFSYNFNDVGAFQCMGDLINDLARDTGSCVNCMANLAGMILSGGPGAILGIILLIIIIYVVRYIYREFIEPVHSSYRSGGSAPEIILGAEPGSMQSG